MIIPANAALKLIANNNAVADGVTTDNSKRYYIITNYKMQRIDHVEICDKMSKKWAKIEEAFGKRLTGEFNQKECDLYFENMRERQEEEGEGEECDCGRCRYCKAHSSSDYDYETDEYECSRCNGGGCTRCE